MNERGLWSLARPAKNHCLLGALVVAGIALATPERARAEETELRDAAHYYQLALPGTWQRVVPAPGPETILVAAQASPGDRRLAITRIAYPNPKRKKSSFHNQVESGLQRTVRGYKRLHRKNRKIRKVPVMDLVFRRERASKTGPGSRVLARAEHEVVWMRFLFFRTFTLSLTVTAPAKHYKRSDRRTRKLLRSFQPYFAD